MFAIAFATSNEALITLYLWPFEGALTAPIWLLILSSFIIGGLLSISLLWTQWLAIRTRLWRLQGKFNKLQAQMTQQRDGNEAYGTEQAEDFSTTSHESGKSKEQIKADPDISETLRPNLELN